MSQEKSLERPFTEPRRILTGCGRVIDVSRFDAEGLHAGSGRVILDLPIEPLDNHEVRASLTPREVRELAGTLLAQAAAVERAEAERRGEGDIRDIAAPGRVAVTHVEGDVVH